MKTLAMCLPLLFFHSMDTMPRHRSPHELLLDFLAHGEPDAPSLFIGSGTNLIVNLGLRRYVAGRYYLLPFRDGFFRAVFKRRGPLSNSGIAEIARVLSPHGFFILMQKEVHANLRLTSHNFIRLPFTWSGFSIYQKAREASA